MFTLSELVMNYEETKDFLSMVKTDVSEEEAKSVIDFILEYEVIVSDTNSEEAKIKNKKNKEEVAKDALNQIRQSGTAFYFETEGITVIMFARIAIFGILHEPGHNHLLLLPKIYFIDKDGEISSDTEINYCLKSKI